MNNIFKNASIFRVESKLSKYSDCIPFLSNLKYNISETLKNLKNDIENKFNSCLEYFSINEDLTEKNTNNNIDLLKKYFLKYFFK